MTYEEKLKDIKDHPYDHQHSFEALQKCCFLNGAMDLRLIDAHEDIIGRTNGGVRCDIIDGPCACGAWH